MRYRVLPALLPLTLLSAIALATIGGTAIAAEKTVETGRFSHICAAAIATAERQHAIPAQLLTAISHAESGRWDATARATIAWPWTVTAQGTGHYLPNRAAAIAKVEALRTRGIANIDVGCMQINLRYHPDAFDNLDSAFDPATNAAYAGKFLAALKRETGSWQAATARYHSATPKFAGPYKARVMRLWRTARAGAPTALSPAPPSPAALPPEARPNDANETAAAALPADEQKRRDEAAAHRRAVVASYLARRAEQRAARLTRLAAVTQ